jgi:hypothetical protein
MDHGLKHGYVFIDLVHLILTHVPSPDDTDCVIVLALILTVSLSWHFLIPKVYNDGWQEGDAQGFA